MSTIPNSTAPRVTVPRLHDMKRNQQKIAMTTCYDASFARLCDDAEVDILLIGDSLGNVIHGSRNTLAVTLDDVIYHTRCVVAGSNRAMVMTDLPFASYHASPQQAYTSAAKALATGAQMVKLEGGAWLLPTLEFLAARDIPVCAHVGFMPQSVNKIGGYKVQGKLAADAERISQEALALQNAGADMLLMEMVPAMLAHSITEMLAIPTIGIGAGPDTDGQVLVLYDLLGIYPSRARFVKNFVADGLTIPEAIQAYVSAVKSGTFPEQQHSF